MGYNANIPRAERLRAPSTKGPTDAEAAMCLRAAGNLETNDRSRGRTRCPQMSARIVMRPPPACCPASKSLAYKYRQQAPLSTVASSSGTRWRATRMSPSRAHPSDRDAGVNRCAFNMAGHSR